MKAEADVGVAWWVWPCGCHVVGVGIVWVCEVGLAALVWWRRHSVGSSKISSSHLTFWQLHSRRGQRQSLSPLTVFFFFVFWKASHSLCLASALGFPFGRVIPSGVSFFPFVFPFGLRRLESSVRLLGFFFWKLTYLDFFFFFFFFASGLAGWVTILEELKLFVRG